MLIDTFVYLCETKTSLIKEKFPLIFIPNWDKPSFYGPYIMEAAKHDKSLFAKLEKNGFIEYTPFARRPKFNTEAVIATYGYSITAHKSQGSQWDKVFINQNFFSDKWDNSRWYYTAVTRSAKDVVVLDSGNNPKISIEEMEQKLEKTKI